LSRLRQYVACAESWLCVYYSSFHWEKAPEYLFDQKLLQLTKNISPRLEGKMHIKPTLGPVTRTPNIKKFQLTKRSTPPSRKP
jgi:hypothetical protein